MTHVQPGDLPKLPASFSRSVEKKYACCFGNLTMHPVGASVFPSPDKGLCAFNGPIIPCSLDFVCIPRVSSACLQPQLSLAFPNSTPKKGIPLCHLPVQADLCKYKWLRQDVL